MEFPNPPFFKIRHLCWHTALYPFPLGLILLTDNRSLLQSMWDSPIHLSSRSSILTGTPSHVYPLRGSSFSLVHRLVLSSYTICNSSSPPLANIVLSRLSLEGMISPRDFKNVQRVCWRGSPPQPMWRVGDIRCLCVN